MGGAVQPIQNAVLVGLTTNDERTGYFSLFTFISGMAAALGALLATVLEVRNIFLAAAIISAIGVPMLLTVPVAAAGGKFAYLKTRTVIGKFTLTGALNGFSQGLVVPFLIPFFVLVYHVPKSEMSLYAFVSGMLGSFALLGAPLLERRFGFVNSVVITRGIGLVLFVLFPVIRLLPVAVAIYILASSLRVAAMPIRQSEMTKQVDSDEMGRALGINQMAQLSASSVGTVMSGHLLDASLFELPFFLYGLIMTWNLVLYVRFFGAKRN
ncbi:MAG: MFS transporter [Acidiferrobacterales bacterium]